MDFSTITSNLLTGAVHIIKAPFQNLDIWWYLFPILTLWITLEFYFGFYKSESMGWNTALGNAFSFAWVNIEGMRVLFDRGLDLFWIRFTILLIAILYSALIIYLVFTHRVKDKYTFLAASPHLTYFLSAVSIMWMHGALVIDWWVLLDLFILFWITVVLFLFIKKFLPHRKSINSSKFSDNDRNSSDFGYQKVGFDDSSSNYGSNNLVSKQNLNTSKKSKDKDTSSRSNLDFLNKK